MSREAPPPLPGGYNMGRFSVGEKMFDKGRRCNGDTLNMGLELTERRRGDEGEDR